MENERTVPAGRRKDAPPRRQRPTIMAGVLAAVLDAPTRRQGFADARLVTDWATIIGADVAQDTRPLKLDRRSRTLTLKVRPSAALLLQHQEPLLLERINAFFGHPVAHRIRLVQGPLPRPSAPVTPTAPSEAERGAVTARVASVEPDHLRAALAALGLALKVQRPRDEGADP